jgi:diacylglycerol O-acyltransferase / trehalose O-mycolyltransferase
MRSWWIAVMATALVAGIVAVGPARADEVAVSRGAPECLPRTAPIQLGATLAKADPVPNHPRVTDLTLHSTAMQNDVHVDVLVPPGYDASGRTQYPVLYLLHGALGKYSDYVDNGIDTIVGNREVIVVMPDDGVDGSYSDWYGMLPGTGDPNQAPAWESFHTRELIPFIDSSYPTIANRTGRFVAGISSGGAGAMKYAAHNPQLFGAVGSMSGAVDLHLSGYPPVSEVLWGVTLIPGEGPVGYCTWGDYVTQEILWRDSDATYLAPNLKGLPLFVSSGDGSTGPNDDYAAAGTESSIWAMNQQFVIALDTAGVPHDDDFYSPGTHAWSYWTQVMSTRFFPWLDTQLGHVARQGPATFTMRSMRMDFSAWGRDFHARRSVPEFLYLHDIGLTGGELAGSGAVDIATAALYKHGHTYKVAVGNAPLMLVTADRTGRLHFTVDLGPSHIVQQTKFDDGASSTWDDSANTSDWVHERVTISP